MLWFLPIQVPCIAVVENMCYFEGDGKRYHPFGQGSGAQVTEVSHLQSLTTSRNQLSIIRFQIPLY